MKKLILAITLAVFSAGAVGATPLYYQFDSEQRRDDKKKDPPGPPVVKDKGKDEKPKNPPPKDKRKPD